jgi:hypothetical protein
MLRQSTNRDPVREFLAYIQVEKGLSANTLQKLRARHREAAVG